MTTTTRNYRPEFLVLLVVISMLLGDAAAASGSEQPITRESTSAAGQADRPALERDPATLPNSELQGLTETYDRRGSLEFSGIVTGDRVLVLIEHQLSVAAANVALINVGATHRTHIGPSFVEAYVPIGRLKALQNQPGVRYVKPAPEVSPPLAQSSEAIPLSIDGDEVSKTGAAAWHSVGLDGSGVKIGIIDDFDQTVWNGAQANGDVPAPAGTVCVEAGFSCNLWTVTPGATHGTAVAEIVHEMAPGATLYLGNGLTLGDLMDVIDYFTAQGVQIINFSATIPYDGPGDGTGPAAAVIDYAASKGIAWVNSAGNSAGGQYWRGTWTDTNANSFLEFSPGDEVMGFVCGSALGLRWDDWTVGNLTDYDVYIWDDIADVWDLGALKAVSLNDQTAGAPPVENFSLSCSGGADVDYLVVDLFDPGDGVSGDVLELGINSLLEYWQDPYSAAIPFGDTFNPGALSVGAVEPPNGTSIASYSSRGPTNDARIKPDLSAPAGMTTFSSGAFSGTSAAAPVVAGASALLFDAGLVSNPAQLKTYLLSSAVVDRGSAGPDNDYGAGELYLGDPPNQQPVGVDDSYDGTEDTQLVVPAAAGVLFNDTDPEDDPLTVSASDATSAEGGAVAVAVDGSFTYDPPGDFFGIDTFDYTVSDGALTDTATVTVTVAGVPDPPVAVDDSYAATKNTQLSKNAAVGLLFNDTDAEDDPLTVSASDVTSAEGGTVVVAVDGSFTYDPPTDYTGIDTFDYTVSDGALTDTATVTITVTGPPVGVDDSYDGTEDTQLVVPAAAGVLFNDTDPDGDDLTVSASDSTSAEGGAVVVAVDGSFTYDPPTDYTGIDSFDYAMSDGALTDTATVTVTVAGVPDPPVAVDDSYAATKNTQLSKTAAGGVLFNDTDPDGDDLTVSASDVTSAEGGTVVVAVDGSFTYDPPTDYTGIDSFDYTVSDGALTDTATVTITVSAPPPPGGGGGGGGGFSPPPVADPCPATIPEAGFTDLAGVHAEAVEAINCIAYYGITTGQTLTTYDPNGKVLRSQMALFLTRTATDLGITLPLSPPDGGFTDLAGVPAEAVTAINQLKALGITTGKTATTFDPAGDVTRRQMAMFVQRLLVKAGVVLDDPPANAGFTDLGATQPDAVIAINQLAALGVVQGTTATTYSPAGNVLRSQMALFLTRSLRAGGVTPD